MNPRRAASLTPRHVLDVPDRRAGHTRITARALTRVVEAITAEAFGTPSDTVTVALHDVRGRLGITAKVSVRAPSLLQAARGDSRTARTDSVYERASRARTVIIDRAGLIAGTQVERVDIRVTGIHRPAEGRVR